LTSFIYCDPPYRNTKGYRVDFDFEKFDNFVRKEVKKGKIFLISEYEMPDDFVCIWSKDIQNSMKPGASDKKCEKLFVHISQLHLFNKQYRLTA
jgi:DNA adenine methylase